MKQMELARLHGAATALRTAHQQLQAAFQQLTRAGVALDAQGDTATVNEVHELAFTVEHLAGDLESTLNGATVLRGEESEPRRKS